MWSELLWILNPYEATNGNKELNRNEENDNA